MPNTTEGMMKLENMIKLIERIGPGTVSRPLQIPDAHDTWLREQYLDERVRALLIADALMVGGFVAMAAKYRGIDVVLSDTHGRHLHVPQPCKVQGRQRSYAGLRMPVIKRADTFARLVPPESGATLAQVMHTGLHTLGTLACGTGKGVRICAAQNLRVAPTSRSDIYELDIDAAMCRLNSDLDAIKPFKG